MRNTLVLFKYYLINSFRPDGKKGSKLTGVIGMLLSGVVFGVIFLLASLFMGRIFHEAELHAEFLATLFLMAQLIVLMFGTVVMVNVMYFSKDVEITLPLPVKHQEIFLSKLMYVYFTELVFAASVMLLSGIAFGVMCALPFYFFVFLLFAVFLVPVLPLVLSSVLCAPVMYVVSFFKNKNYLSIIVLLLLFGTFMFAYSALFSSIGMNPDVSDGGEISLSQEGIESIRNAVGIMLPNIALARMVLLAPAVWDFVWVFGISASLILLALVIASLMYYRGVSAQLEEKKSQKNATGEGYRERSVNKAVFLKDLRELLRYPSLAFMCLLPVVMPLIMVFFMGAITNIPAAAEDFGSFDFSGLMTVIKVWIVLFMGLGMNYTAMTAVSREGSNFAVAKALPVPFSEQIKIKVRLADAALFAGILLAAAAMIITGDNVLTVLSAFVFTMILGNGLNHYLVYGDAKDPKLMWESVNAALKNRRIVFVCIGVVTLITIPLVSVLALVILVLPLLGFSAWAVPAQIIVWAVFCGLAVLLNYLFRLKMKRNIQRIIDGYEF